MSQPVTKVSLTGIKPTGEPHLGNLIGAIRPALELAEKYDSIYFISRTTTRSPPNAIRRRFGTTPVRWRRPG